MKAIPNTSKAYVALLCMATTAILGRAFVKNGFSFSENEALLGIVLLAMIILVERFRVEFRNRSFQFSTSASTILALGASFALSPLQSACIVIAAGLVGDLSFRLRPIQMMTNAANLGLATFLASLAYHRISGDAISPLQSPSSFGATIVASVVYTVVNIGALSLIVAPVIGETPIGMWKANFLSSYAIVSLPMLGSLVPITANPHPWGVLILAVPLAGSHFALRTLRKVEVETQATIVSLTDALEFRDAYTHHHSARVTEYVEAILEEMPHIPSRMRLTTVEAARIHDVGKVGIRDTALLKSGPLTDEERREMQRHSSIGADIVGNLDMYRQGATIVRHHHERWDGAGYPAGLKELEIPLGARIIAVADSFDAMTSDRPYRRALTVATALGEIRRSSGSQFDPAVVEAFERAMLKPYGVEEREPSRAPLPAD